MVSSAPASGYSEVPADQVTAIPHPDDPALSIITVIDTVPVAPGAPRYFKVVLE
jgi:hypothetical protein